MIRDVRHALRAIARMPGFAAVVIISLGIGIGANTAIFSWIQAVALEPLPGVAHASSFYWIEAHSETGDYPGASWPEYRDLGRRLTTFDDLVAFRMVPLNVGETTRTERAYGLLVSGNYFSTLGLEPAAGRFPTVDDADRPTADPVVVVSYGFWKAHLGGSPAVVGTTLRVNDRDLTISAVTPEGFQGTVLALDFDLWVPAALAPSLLNGSRELDDRSMRGYYVMGRLQRHVSSAQAQADVGAAMRDLARMYPASNRTIGGELVPFWKAPRGPQRLLLPALVLLQSMMLLVLAAVCANTANLVLSRTIARSREAGILLALGASPARVVRLLVVENVVLSSLGAALGAAIAAWGSQAFRAVPMITAVPLRFQSGLDLIGLAFAIGLGLLCGVAFGLPPALQLARVDPRTALGSGSFSAPRSRIGHAVMGVEAAVALIVLIMAGVFLEGFSETRDADPGFKRQGVLLAAYDLTIRPTDDAFREAFANRVLQKIRSLPGIDAAAMAQSVPLDIHGWPSRRFSLEGRPRTDAGEDEALINTVTPGYFQTMAIPLIAGTDFADLDNVAAPLQVIVNQAFVRRYSSGLEPIGRRVTIGDRGYLIAGVVKDSVYESFGEAPLPAMFLSYRGRPVARGEIHIRVRGGSETAVTAAVRRAVREVDPSLPLYDVRTLADHVEKNLFLRRIPARMFAIIGPLLLVLAAIGMYAVVSCTVAQRTLEIGVRLALGATGAHVLRQILIETMPAIAAGALLGWVIAFAVGLHVLSGQGVSLVVFGGVPALLLTVAAVACWLPARRAARVDPMVVMRP